MIYIRSNAFDLLKALFHKFDINKAIKKRQGIASTILKALEIWCKELGIKKCVLETGKKQPEAIALYKKNRYNIIPNFGKYEGV